MTAQPDLFGESAAAERTREGEGVARDAQILRLASQLSPRIHLGESWGTSFASAGGIRKSPMSGGDLPNHGIEALARHPLFRAVGLDHAFYAPLREDEFRRFAGQVPADIRFLVKAPQSLTAAYRFESREPSAHFLDPAAARHLFVDPCVAGLGIAAGPLVFQFPPQGRTTTREPAAFALRLETFLRGLPPGPLYAVEFRDRELLGPDTMRALARGGVRLCLSVHARMPPAPVQAAAATSTGAGPLVIRWNLRSGHAPDETDARAAPRDRLVGEDAVTRAQIATLCRDSAQQGQDAWVIANDEAQGCAPRTVERLAQAIVDGSRG